VLSEQKLNSYIKEVCKLAGFNRLERINRTSKGETVTVSRPRYSLITTHSARRSAATNMYLAGINVYDIMKITGHKKLESFQRYIKIDQEDSLKRMERSSFFHGSGHLKAVS